MAKKDERPVVKIEPCTDNSVTVFIGDIQVFAVNGDDPIYEITTNGKTVRIRP